MIKTKAYFLRSGQKFKIGGLESQMKDLEMVLPGPCSCIIKGEFKNGNDTWVKKNNELIAPSTEVLVKQRKNKK